MGCCNSNPVNEQSSQRALVNNPSASNNNTKGSSTSAGGGPAAPGSKESQIALAFKAKRANVFTASVDVDVRRAFSAKNIPKTPKQEMLIKTALSQNFVFDSLDELDTRVLVNAMEIVNISPGENIITQGEEGDYFYIVERGNFTVIVDKKPVATIGEGKSFGELALVYNTPRQATIRADTAATLFSLDRATFKYTLANNMEKKNSDIEDALAKVPLLRNLTDDQRSRLADTVELIGYNAGDEIIRKGSEGTVFYIIKDGVVSIEDVGDKFKAHKLGPGDYFGERALMTNEPRAATVRADGKVNVMALDKVAFHKLLGPLQEVLDYNLSMRVLSSVKLFEKLTSPERIKLCKSFEPESFPAGTVIIRQGDKGRKFYVLVEGNAQVLADDVKVGELKSGDYFGEMALLDDELRKATVVAVNDCKCFNIDRPTFNRILGSLHHVMSRETMQRLETLHGGGVSAGEEAVPQLNLRFQDLTHLAVLGSGTFGRVTLVQDKATKQVYALKAMLKSEIVAHKQQSNVLNEKNVMMACNNPFILRLYQTFKDPKKLYMLLEFIQGGELFSVLHKANSDGVPDYHAKFYAIGVTNALAYLHAKDIAYRDMKPENCLIDKDGYPKLVDFGFAKVITGKSFTLCGTPEYLAPELVLGRGHNKAVDYWALGILIFEMEAGYSPYSDQSGNMDQVVICKNIVNGQLRFPPQYNADCKDLVKKLLTREVANRLGNLKGGAEDIKQHKWFSGVDAEAYYKKTIRAPWIPSVKSPTDTSQFDPYGADDHKDDGYIDHGTWDKDF